MTITATFDVDDTFAEELPDWPVGVGAPVPYVAYGESDSAVLDLDFTAPDGRHVTARQYHGGGTYGEDYNEWLVDGLRCSDTDIPLDEEQLEQVQNYLEAAHTRMEQAVGSMEYRAMDEARSRIADFAVGAHAVVMTPEG